MENDNSVASMLIVGDVINLLFVLLTLAGKLIALVFIYLGVAIVFIFNLLKMLYRYAKK